MTGRRIGRRGGRGGRGATGRQEVEEEEEGEETRRKSGTCNDTERSTAQRRLRRDNTGIGEDNKSSKRLTGGLREVSLGLTLNRYSFHSTSSSSSSSKSAYVP
eukprot:755030-Hanusia_phi.AAC.1